ncbi:MAG: bifunctional folylpolyglutamate synthase/dihydrofolate synthase [Deltaproteobacteria bacterium]|nr:bifunctional folylpolyglutamate synthase/dihydrofolate synthase [Deltaproteobacteria bacterium]
MGITPSYSKTLRYLYGLQRLGIRPGLVRIKKLLSRLGNPQNACASIHVAGTNGKGSTAAMLEAMLTEAGLKAGLYTSPHLVRFTERIRISGKEISGRDAARTAASVRRAAEETGLSPTLFEFTTALCFEYFRDAGVDIAVIETGMGGRLDATNVISPLVSVITSVGLDHTEHLGESIGDIAREKAGIIKRGGAAVLGEEDPAAVKAVKAAAERADAEFRRLGYDFRVTAGSKGSFDYHGMGKDLKGLRLNLMGAHQRRNAACALASVELLGRRGFYITEAAVRRGLKRTLWPGRLEVVRRRPLCILDCAHNPDGARILKEALEGDFTFKRLILVAGIMADKDIDGIFRRLAPLSDAVIVTAPAGERAARPDLLAARLKPYGKEVIVSSSVKAALRAAAEMAGDTDAVCVTGSIFTVGEAKRSLVQAFRNQKKHV